jgi:hypothetical protein
VNRGSSITARDPHHDRPFRNALIAAGQKAVVALELGSALAIVLVQTVSAAKPVREIAALAEVRVANSRHRHGQQRHRRG